MGKDPLTEKVIGGAVKVHRALGPGLVGKVCQQGLADELGQAGIAFQLEVPLSVDDKNIHQDCGYRSDAVVEARELLNSSRCMNWLESIQLSFSPT